MHLVETAYKDYDFSKIKKYRSIAPTTFCVPICLKHRKICHFEFHYGKMSEMLKCFGTSKGSANYILETTSFCKS